MTYPFGKDIPYTFYPLVDNNLVLNIPAQGSSLNIYIFGDNARPSRDAAQNGTNKLSGTSAITSWTQVGTGFQFTIPAIADPDPDSTIDQRRYWIAINFILQSGGAVQTVIKALDLERVQAHHKQISITPIDVLNVFPQIDSYVSTEEIIGLIAVSKENIKSDLKDKGYEWAQINRPDRLNLACLNKTLMQVMISQRKQIGDNFHQNFLEFQRDYNSSMNSLKLEYDSTRTGDPSPEKKTGGYILTIR